MIRISEELLEAQRDGRGIVALETTLIAHGFPPGEGIEVGLASEAAVREGGSLPATVGVLDGEIVVGLSRDELARFDETARKLGPRDLAAALVQGVVGATTVGGTLTVMNACGLQFMATGGLGGVHRGWPSPPDVSADLQALAQTQALVVSSGVKSLLDVPATAELLETLGVPVLGWKVHTLPLFYSARGGPAVSATVETAPEAARLASAHWDLIGGGLLLGRPPTREPRRRRAADRARPRGRRCPGHPRPGRHPVRARVPAPGERRRDAAREPRADRRQRAARRRDRGCRPTNRRLALDPDAVFLHEPAVGIDATTVAQVLDDVPVDRAHVRSRRSRCRSCRRAKWTVPSIFSSKATFFMNRWIPRVAADPELTETAGAIVGRERLEQELLAALAPTPRRSGRPRSEGARPTTSRPK